MIRGRAWVEARVGVRGNYKVELFVRVGVRVWVRVRVRVRVRVVPGLGSLLSLWQR